MKPMLEKPNRYLSKLKSATRRRWLNPQNKVVRLAASGGRPDVVFGSVSDDLWLWANTEGYREHQALRDMLPSMPNDSTQLRFTGLKGDATMIRAFSAYTLVKQLTEKYLGEISGLESILDFGCGWGRMARFFLKDLEPSRIWGADCLSGIIDVCKQTNKWSNFRTVDPLPPTTFPDGMFDLIYSYSVFSHLSEDAHLRWLTEFKRILKPGGLLIATTRSRQFVEYCNSLSQTSVGEGRPPAIARAFPNMEQTLSDYDNGRYCHYPLGGGDILDKT